MGRGWLIEVFMILRAVDARHGQASDSIARFRPPKASGVFDHRTERLPRRLGEPMNIEWRSAARRQPPFELAA
jgi:hypothetical protein